MGINVVVTQPYNVRSAPDFTCSIRIQAWTHLNMCFRSRVWQNGSTSATYTDSAESPQATFHVHVWKSVHSCNVTIPTKKSPGTKYETQQEVGYFEFLVIFSDIFAIWQVSYFNELLPEIYSHEHQNWSLKSKALWDVKLRRSRVFIGGRVRGRPVKFRCFAMKQEVVITQACYVRPAPNFTCLIRLSDMKRSTWPYSVIVISDHLPAQEVTCFTL